MAAASLAQDPSAPGSAPPDTSSPPPSAASTLPIGPVAPAPFAPVELAPAPDSAAQRPRAVTYSDAYYTRLEIHRIASYATVPLFVGQYLVGTKLYNNPPGSNSTRTLHSALALGVTGLFGVNTITGVWNLWDSRHVSEGRARRYIHALLMIASDAGFAATALNAPGGRIARDTTAVGASRRSNHRTLAIVSMSAALTSYGMMLIWK